MHFRTESQIIDHEKEVLSPEFQELINAFKRKKTLLSTVKILAQNYPQPVRKAELSNQHSAQLDNNLIELRISRTRAFLQENKLPFSIIQIKGFGYQLVKSSDTEKVLPWWAEFKAVDRKILLALLEKSLTLQEIYLLTQESDTLISSPENIEDTIYTRITRLRRDLQMARLGWITNERKSSYSFQLNPDLDKEKIIADLNESM